MSYGIEVVGVDYRNELPPDKFDTQDVNTLRCIKVPAESMLYHGYAGDRHSALDHEKSTDVIRHGDGETRKQTNDLEAFCKSEFNWIDVLTTIDQPFEQVEGNIFFTGPKTLADHYGSRKHNTLTVKETSEKLSKVAYQLCSPNGVTIGFKTKKDMLLVDLSEIGNAENLMTFFEFERTRAQKVAIGPDRTAIYLLLHSAQHAFSVNASGKVARFSTHIDDDNLFAVVQMWLKAMHVFPLVDGVFWGGYLWPTHDGTGLHAQEFIIFNPSDTLAYENHSRMQGDHLYSNIPTYKEYLQRGGSPDTIQDVLLGGRLRKSYEQ
jgi:hypothetical protein